MSSSAMHLEQYLDSLEDLPSALQKNFTQMRDLDIGVQGTMANVDESAEDYLHHIHTRSAKERTAKMADINKLFSKVNEYGTRKVALAKETYEMVDQHIRKLDQDLARFESEIKEKTTVPTKGVESTKRVNKLRKDKDGPSSSKKKKTPIRERSASPTAVTTIPSTEVIDMPVDPNEPTYCVCHEVSYGEMIGCDNSDCPVEWFHFPCVGLTIKPKGKWYCPNCIGERKKK